MATPDCPPDRPLDRPPAPPRPSASGTAWPENRWQRLTGAAGIILLGLSTLLLSSVFLTLLEPQAGWAGMVFTWLFLPTTVAAGVLCGLFAARHGNVRLRCLHLGVLVIVAGSLTTALFQKETYFSLHLPAPEQNSPASVLLPLPGWEGGEIRLTSFSPADQHIVGVRSIATATADTPSAEMPIQISPNHPARIGKWSVYLSGFEPEEDGGIQPRLTLRARKDPGRDIIYLGYALVAIGLLLPTTRNRPSHRE